MYINKFNILFNLFIYSLLIFLFFILFNFISLYTILFTLDSISIYLSVVPILFFLVFFGSVYNDLNNFSCILLLISIISSFFCYNINNNFYFWFFYELSILPLVFLKYRSSIYSERFNSLWYFVGYLSLSSFPLLFSLVFISNDFLFSSLILYYLNIFIFILFIVKIPLPPFHSWLPVVHAEANSYVSILLSGYIMKLGIIGVYRYCSFLMGESFGYLLLIFFFSLFFFINSFLELDVKRWLAFLSLSHILISYVGLNVLSFFDNNLLSFYCLGHGVSAALLFYLFFLFNNVVGSRNWLVINNVNNNSIFFRLLVSVSILTLASFPPTIQFVSEVFILLNSIFNLNLVFNYCIYLFLGGLIPLMLLSYFLSRNSNIVNFNFFYSINFILYILIFFCYFTPLFF
uniref:NADH-ubiquinone oxidoreductase chain 4 n=1 Tax=Benedenia seriolae TaxID=160838 RepID=A0A499VQ00_BENSE|nr:NADH dehydrogenase subunit 4 [Benedenia seriolae]BBJ70700.1 NADH dehydrogenase subunit 4 [Benedenia seriolae]BBJ70712.1 NADH dehydrogenase subunit 4 [Benedenia seriolae]BBJ70724.1 NADH dehydrogenase subunit 4 [Benedenia seriolae]